jgi:C-terminal processing protease CtpA/Prc
MKSGSRRAPRLCSIFVGFIVLALTSASGLLSAQQGLDRVQRQRVQQMLTSIRNEIKKKYYDPTYHGKDIDAHFAAAGQKIEAASSLAQGLAIIAQALLDLNDSHTYFVPPSRSTRVEYGWQMQMIGEDCFVTAVRPGTDAQAKGLKPGDRVVALEGRRPTRADLWKMEYVFYTLSPRPILRLQVASPGGEPHPVEIAARITQGKRILDLTGADGGSDIDSWIRDIEAQTHLREFRVIQKDGVALWSLPTFDFDPEQVDRLVDEATKGAKALVIDLRGNGGGYVATLERFAGRFFDREITIATRHGRKPMKAMVSRRKGKVVEIPLTVLIDSRSGSAAELFARVVQLEKRGTVVGDRSSGAVMQATYYDGEMGADRVILYGASITNANLLMSDGKSLELTGVIPDELLVPTAADIAAGRDPVLARAAALLGLSIDATAAGGLFPVDWR